MTTKDTLKILEQGYEVWNEWRKKNNDFIPNLRFVKLQGFDFSNYNLGNVDFSAADLSDCKFIDASLWWTIFVNANLTNATIESTNPLRFHDPFFGLNIRWSNFSSCNLTNAKLSYNLFECSQFIKTNLSGADISNNRIYGINVWDILTDEKTKQDNLIVTASGEPLFIVDNLELAQFIDFFLNSEKIKDIIDLTSNSLVLILGSFTSGDKIILSRVKEELLRKNLVPVIYDFSKPNKRSHTETVSLIAHLSKFIVGDLTNQRSIPHELATIIPRLPSVPFIPICKKDYIPYGMFEDFKSYKNVCDIQFYQNENEINEKFIHTIINFADNK